MTDAREEFERLHERNVVARAQSGDRDAFGQLVAQYQDRLTYYVHRLIDDREQSRDVLQEIWLEVFRKLAGLQSPAAFRVWLYRVAHNRAVTFLRRRGRAPQSYDETGGENCQIESWNELELLENAELVHFALARLSEAHREVMTLRFVEDMHVNDLARVIGCSEGTAKSRLHYAKAALRRIIEEERGNA